MTPMSYSPAGLALTKRFEGCRLKAYQDSVGVWTIGYGHTGPEVHAGLVWTQAQADAALMADLARGVSAVNRLVRTEISQTQFDALVDFSFNLGPEALHRSTLLRKVNVGDFGGATAEFEKWDEAGGRVLPGLLLRRQAEAAMFAGK